MYGYTTDKTYNIRLFGIDELGNEYLIKGFKIIDAECMSRDEIEVWKELMLRRIRPTLNEEVCISHWEENFRLNEEVMAEYEEIWEEVEAEYEDEDEVFEDEIQEEVDRRYAERHGLLWDDWA